MFLEGYVRKGMLSCLRTEHGNQGHITLFCGHFPISKCDFYNKVNHHFSFTIKSLTQQKLLTTYIICLNFTNQNHALYFPFSSILFCHHDYYLFSSHKNTKSSEFSRKLKCINMHYRKDIKI